MVARVWRGHTTLSDAGAYQEHLRADTLPGLQALDGFEQALVLRRVVGDEIEFLVLTFWTSLEAICAFAGKDVERAVIPPAAAQVLKAWDERVRHFEVALTASR